MASCPPTSLEEANKRLQQEIAQRRRAEEANATYAAIVEHSRDSIIGQKLDGTIVTWNRGAELMFGYTADEACGRPISFLAEAAQEEEFKRVNRAIRRGEDVPEYETERIRKDGTRIQVSLTVSPICDSNGRVVGASRIARDITQRKQMEQALRESEARARAILDTAVDAIITIDAGGTIQSFNKAAERMFGYDAAEVVGGNVRVLMPEPYKGQHDGYVQSYLDTGKAKIIGIGREVVGLRKDGSVFPADLAVSDVRLADGRHVFTGILRDLSERKRLEREILEISDREKRRIGQDMHDSLGQLLTGIGFKSKSLENKLAAKEIPESTVAHSIADLVTQAIMQARGLARGLQPVEPRPGGLMSALQELSQSVSDLFKVSCVFECPRGVQMADPVAATHLYRIAQEACNNAIKHGRANQIVISLEIVDRDLVLAIRDDGAGFGNVPITGGMGLQIMRYRAAMAGGSVAIAGADPQGTIVSCRCAFPP